MIVVLDAGIIASGLVRVSDPESTTGSVMRLVVFGGISNVTSDYILGEAERVLANKRYFRVRVSDERRRLVIDAVGALSLVVPLPDTVPRVAPHRHDDAVLATVAASGADWFVTGDAALLAMRSYDGVPFADPARFLDALVSEAG